MRDLNVTLVQGMLHWEDAEANRWMFGELLSSLPGNRDLIVLPEMFTTGFSMRGKELAETMDGPTLAWLKEHAKATDAALYGSVIIRSEGKYYNRGLFVLPSGEVTVYDKRHLFRFAGEHEHYSPGSQRVVVEWRGWRVLLQVCYDLRFPVFSRNRSDYDAALYVANWPEARSHPWHHLLLARAIENQAYVLGVNRVGMDGKGIHYGGGSVVVDPRGDASTAPAGISVLHSVLDGRALQEFREKFPVSLDADDFTLLT